MVYVRFDLRDLITFCGVVVVAFIILSSILRKNAFAEASVAGCRRVGLVTQSNMRDQYSAAHSGAENNDASGCKVKALFIYPIKSCGRIELQQSDLILAGLRYDRQFCLAQLKTEEADTKDNSQTVRTEWKHQWKFITQRQTPQLSQIATEIWLPDPSSWSYSPKAAWVKTKGCLLCKFPFSPEVRLDGQGLRNLWTVLKVKIAERSLSAQPFITFKLPLEPDATRAAKYSRESMQIWKDCPEAVNMTSEIPPDTLAKLKYFLGLSNPLAIFKTDPLKQREVYRNAPRIAVVGFQPEVGFADSFPVSIMGLPSVHAVSDSLFETRHESLNALRFRANIYVTDLPAFAEDHWRKIRIGDSVFDVSCRTTRCQLPNVDPETGIKDKQEPYKTLMETRGKVDEGASPTSCLGMQMVPLLKDHKGTERIAVGDSVQVLDTGEHYYIKS